MTGTKTAFHLALLGIALALPAGARAQAWPGAYGPPIGLDAARKASDAALAEARKNGWNVAAAVVDPSGTLVFYQKMEQTQTGSAVVAVEKARTAALFRRASKVLEDLVNGGKVNYLALPGAIPIEGGLPIVVEGKIVGAIGVSGATSAQDGTCARAGAETAGPQPQPPAPPPAK
jgi:glc operon protein GlcG